MKIVSTFKRDLFSIGVSSTLGSTFPLHLWNANTISAYDLFDIEKPDLLICHAEFIQNYFLDVLNEFSDTKLILIKTADEATILDDRAASILTPVPLANLVGFGKGTFDKFLATDVLYISRNPNPELDEIVKTLTADYNVKIFGAHRVKVPQYLGLLTNVQVAQAFASAKVCIDNHYSCFDAAINKTPSVVFTNEDYGPFPTCSDNRTLREQLDILLSTEKKRQALVKKLYDYVTTEHTFFHYLSKCFIDIGCKEEAKQLISTLGTYV